MNRHRAGNTPRQNREYRRRRWANALHIEALEYDDIKGELMRYVGKENCYFCGVATLPPVCYDFHHNFYSGKRGDVSGMKMHPRRAIEEARICFVLCAHCHRILHQYGYDVAHVIGTFSLARRQGLKLED